MQKILTIAFREYRAMIVTKGFLIGLALVPILFGGGAIIPHVFGKKLDLGDKKIVVLDRSGRLFEPLAQAAEQRNTVEIVDPATKTQTAAKFVVERGPGGPIDDELRLSLSERIRSREIYAFVEINENALDPAAGVGAAAYHSESSALSEARQWMERTLSQIVRIERFGAAGVDPEVVATSSMPVTITPRGLFDRSSSGDVRSADRSNPMEAIFVPMGFMMLMFMIVFMAFQPMLECVLEEKQHRIGEVLLGSVNATQLMWGKLLGNVAGSLTTIAIYAAGGLTVAHFNNVLDKIPWHVVPWFVVFQLLAVLMYSAIVMALAASANNLQEVQGLLIIVWIPLIIPMFLWFNVVREPTGALAAWMSLFPPVTPMMMVLRMAATSAIPMWQVVTGLVLTLATTALCVFAAGRIFRIGMLSQGNTPKLRDVLRWAVAG